MDQKAKAIILSFMGICFFLFVTNFLSLLQEHEYHGYYSTYTRSGLDLAFRGDGAYLAQFIISVLFFILGIITLIIFLIHKNCQIIITDKNVKGKTVFGKEVVLPLYMVSAYTTRKFFSTIAVATSSGITKFSLIKNYAEIGTVLSAKINERQENTATATAQAAPSPASSSMDDLVKLKDLLDKGIITQEEFDAKKKEILGL